MRAGRAWLPVLGLGLAAAIGAVAQQPAPRPQPGSPAEAVSTPAPATGAEGLPQGMPALPPEAVLPGNAASDAGTEGEGAAPPTGALPDLPADIPLDIPATDAQQQQVADPQTLAELRTQLAAIGRALQSLRAELVASGPAGFTAAGGAPAIERMDQMEAQIASLTGAVEEMRNRVEGSIAEAANRAGDIEFRLCEIDPGCDLGALTTAQLDSSVTAAGAAAGGPALVPQADAPPAGTPAENADFDRATAALTAGDNARAADLFAAFAADHPASSMAAEAMFMRGEALAAAGDKAGATGAWLDAFSAAPTGRKAPQALLAVAGAMAGTGKTDDACLFYADVPARFPGSPEAAEAERQAKALTCPAAAPAPDAAAPAMDPEEAADLADGG